MASRSADPALLPYGAILTDREIAQLARAKADAALRRVHRAPPGQARDNRIVTLQHTVASLDLLLSGEPGLVSPYDPRGVVFTLGGDLWIEGDWVVNLEGGEDYCLACARSLLLMGDLSPEVVSPYRLAVGDPEWSVFCAHCDACLYYVNEAEGQPDEAPDPEGGQ